MRIFGTIVVGMLVMLLLPGTYALAQGNDDYREDPLKTTEDTDNTDDGEETSSSSGNFITNIFSGGDNPGDKGKLIELLPASAANIPPAQPGTPGGYDLARREANGPNMVPVPLPKAKAYTEVVLRRLLASMGIHGFEPRILIVSADKITASALPDGTVLVSLGVFRNLKSEDAFAAILAHEFSHVLLRHHSSDWFMDSQKRGLAVVNMVMEYKEQLKNQQTEKKLVDNYKNRLMGEALVLASEILVASPFGRVAEDESDLLGTDMLIRAGYNPEGMIEMLAKLAAQEEVDAAAKKTAEKEGFKGGTPGELFSSLTNVFSEITSSIKTDLLSEFGDDHRPAEGRLELVAEYLGKYYGDLPPAEMSFDQWQSLVSGPHFETVLQAYRSTIEARHALADSDIQGAVQSVQRALEKLGRGSHVLPLTVAAEISLAVGDHQTAAYYYEKGTKGFMPTTRVYTGLGKALLDSGHPQEALKALEDGDRDLINPPQFFPTKIYMSRKIPSNSKNKKLQTEGLVARCRVEGLDDLSKLCKKRAEESLHKTAPNSLPHGAKVYAMALRPARGVKPAAAMHSEGQKKQLVKSISQNLNARSGPSTNSPKVTSYTPGQTLIVLNSVVTADNRKWLQVQGPNNKIAWVAGWLTKSVRFVKAAKAQPQKPAKAPVTQVTSEQRAKPSSVDKKGDPAKRLRRLKDLHDQGLLTDEEYSTKRQEILDTL